ncbi:MAG: hypothetical protein ACOCZ5_01400 [bacterium]
MKTISISEAIEQVTKSAENNIEDVRICYHMQPGQVVRQGDIYIHRVKKDHKHGKQSVNNQLAIGNSKGSRHFAESPAICYDGVEAPQYCDGGTLLGPVVKSSEAFVVSHPEHANIHLSAGTYQITHQMDARTLDRVRD